jgi:polyphenol oxidase
MILHNDSSFLIYFGDARDGCVKSSGDNDSYSQSFLKYQENLNLKYLIFLKQQHGVDGIIIDNISDLKSNLSLFEHLGDFIVTNQRHIGIGVVTADCLPVVFYDPVHHVVSAVHAGWRGSVGDIIKKTCQTMQAKFNSKFTDLVVYFGPSAKVCCYQIQKSFVSNLESFTFIERFIIDRQGDLFFNLPCFVEYQLLELGLKPQNIHKEYNSCTICDKRFHSYRRDNTLCRQVTGVALK